MEKELEQLMKYSKIQSFICKNDDLENGIIQLIIKPTFDCMSNVAYLWDKKELYKNEFDEFDKEVNGKTLTELKKRTYLSI